MSMPIRSRADLELAAPKKRISKNNHSERRRAKRRPNSARMTWSQRRRLQYRWTACRHWDASLFIQMSLPHRDMARIPSWDSHLDGKIL